MRYFIAFILLLLTAIAAANLVGDKGYILIAMGNWTIESTLVGGIILLIGFWLTWAIVKKLLGKTINIGSKGWHKIAFASKTRANNRFDQALAAYALQDYQSCQDLLEKCAEHCRQPALAWLYAADAANRLGNKQKSRYFLQYLEQSLAQTPMGLNTTLVIINILMQQKDYQKVRNIIDNNHKLIGHNHHLLGFEIALCIEEQRFQAAVDYLPLAQKQKAFTEQQLFAWQHQAFYGVFSNMIKQQSFEKLQQYWQQLAKKTQQLDGVFFAYCQVLSEQKLHLKLVELLIPKLKKQPSEQFINCLSQLIINHAEPLIAITQKHLQKDENNIHWLKLLAHLAASSQQWALAAKVFLKLQQAYNEHNMVLSTVDQQQFAKVLLMQGDNEQAAKLLLQKQSTET